MKILNITISFCSKCPYNQHTEYYGGNGGYFCNHKQPPKLIIKDDIIGSQSNFINYPIPDWCELKDIRTAKLENILKLIKK